MRVSVSPGAVARSELPERHGKAQPGAAQSRPPAALAVGVDRQ